MPLSILTNQQRQLEIGKVSERAFMPKRCTFRARWIVATALGGARVTKSHGDDRNSRFIVENGTIQLHPVAQTIAASITPGNSAVVYLAAGGLTDDQQASGTGQT